MLGGHQSLPGRYEQKTSPVHNSVIGEESFFGEKIFGQVFGSAFDQLSGRWVDGL